MPLLASPPVVPSRRRRLVGIPVGLVLLAAGAPAAGEPAGGVAEAESAGVWQVLESAERRFRVSFPGEPAFHESTTPTAVGAVRDSIWRLVLGPLELVLELHDFPRIASLLMSDDVILAIGWIPTKRIFQGRLVLDEKGYIVSSGVDTSVEGVYVCGDLNDQRYRQVITACGSGCKAALEAERHIGELRSRS